LEWRIIHRCRYRARAARRTPAVARDRMAKL